MMLMKMKKNKAATSNPCDNPPTAYILQLDKSIMKFYVFITLVFGLVGMTLGCFGGIADILNPTEDTTPEVTDQTDPPATPPTPPDYPDPQSSTDNCGHSKYYTPASIVGGNNAAPGQYPWVVRIRVIDGENLRQCVGSIISEM